MPSAPDFQSFPWAHAVLAAASLAILWACWPALGSRPAQSEDLLAHVAVVDLVRSGNLMGWDRLWFAGWPLFQFYPLGFHLVAAAVSFPIAPLAADPAVAATQWLFALGLASLPWSIHALTGALARTDEGPGPPSRAIATAALCLWALFASDSRLVVTLWEQWRLGQVAEPLGWTLMLWFLAQLAWIGRRPGAVGRAALLLAALVLVHQLTAVLAAILALVLSAPRVRHWPALATCAVLAAALSAFFWLPFLIHSADYVRATSRAGDVVLPLELVRVVLLAGDGDRVAAVTNALVVAAMMIALGFGLLRPGPARQLRIAIAGWAIVAVLVGRPETLDWLPTGIHLNRWNHTLIWLLLALVAVPLGRASPRWTGPAAALLFAGLLVAMPEARRALEPSQDLGRYEREVAAWFRDQAPGARVLVERAVRGLSDGALERGNRMTAELHRAGVESANGLYIQSAVHLANLGAAAWSLGVPLFAETAGVPAGSLSPRVTRDWLSRHRVTHIVQARARPLRQPLAGWSEVARFGPVAILAHGGQPTAGLARELHAELVAVVDPGRTGAFPVLDAWSMSAAERGGAVLVAAQPGDPILDRVRGVICVSGGQDDCPPGLPGERPMIVLPARALAPPSLGPADPLQQHRRLVELMASRETAWLEVAPRPAGRVHVVADQHQGNRLVLEGLAPGSLLQLPYNYFPYWRSAGGRVYRSSAGFMLVAADAESVTLDYRRGSDPWTLAGLGLGVAVIIGLLVRSGRRRFAINVS